MIKGYVLQADPEFAYGLNLQIKEQLKWLIGVGAIGPGELLPPAQQLADQLGVNRNTVTLVYTQLRDEGLVSIKKGRGTQVAEGTATDRLRESRGSMYEMLNRIAEDAAADGNDLNELIVASFAFVQLFRRKDVHKKKILFIECREHDYPFYRSQVEQCSGGELVSVFLEDIASNPRVLEEAAKQAQLAVTTLNHAEEVRKLLSDKPLRLVTIGATADISVLLDIAKIEAGSKIAFVCLGKRGGQWMAERVEAAGIRHFDISAAGTDDKEGLWEAIRESNRVFASSAVFDELKVLAPDKVSLFPLVLERSSEEFIREAAK
ncbi:GntR family transcriptional regulator [Paenibacillus sp.]|uniref:GntR family transcriptional regulator n=1 Tax=Paenibacillus sp. TaxID=58172 RepID=UPI0028116917|nr:GntR family transcriptional regulator [Paenibacillus sp.]